MMPKESELERRNRALVASTLLSGARDSAIASFKLRHVDVVGGVVHQDAREVATKFSKSFDSFFLPVGDDVREIVVEWVGYLREVKLWGNDDQLFPATEIKLKKPSRGVFCPTSLKIPDVKNRGRRFRKLIQLYPFAQNTYFNQRLLT